MKLTNTLKQLAIGMSLLVLCSILIMGQLSSTIGGISAQTIGILAIFVTSLILWMSVAIDWPSLLCILALGCLPGVTHPQIFQQSFGNSTFLFLLFTFIVTHALEETHFLKRVVAKAIYSSWAQKSSWRFMTSFFLVVLFVSTLISPTILFMITFPIYEEMMQAFGLKKGDRNASLLLITLFCTIAIGTAMTPINHVFALTAIGIYESAFKEVISHLSYMQVMIPTGLVIFVGLLISLKWIWKVSLPPMQSIHIGELSDLPSVSIQERWVVSLFFLMIILWLLPEGLALGVPSMAKWMKQASIAFPPLVVTLLLAMIPIEGKPVLKLQQALSKGIYWPSLLLVAATLSLGSLLTNPDMGVLSLIQGYLAPLLEKLPASLVVFAIIAWAGIQTNFSSNLVTVSVISTVLVVLTQSSGLQDVHITPLFPLIGFIASLAYMTPPSMPYVAISIGSKWTTAKDTFFYGGWVLVVSLLAANWIGYPLGQWMWEGLL